ncbi:EAL domain-containing protein [Aquisalibacillus elongatus]|uniref:PAS domain S-box-containing protein/diguanylate cyclase (GGDEF)-like protein n=1 Tax=Aquisalibacillus elongatus TaxID=485577 RepID=A0A3N5B9F7_9BACI|nr:EAL domain-containing protein [Aquisalibacillus elongatus]RPF53997.1 PAS domain S-box-containing protein/diguanylate cyclase (GGDEF)-like protein [Aquisalibacillus elongatus]
MTGTNTSYHPALNLEQHHQALVQFYQRFPDGIVTIDTEGRLIDFNPQLLTMLGYHVDDLYLQRFDQFIDDEHRNETSKHFHRVLSGQSVKHYSKVIHKSGYSIPVKITSTPIYVNKQVVGLYTIVHDLIETERNLNALYDTKEKLITAQSVVNIGTWEIDAQSLEVHWSDPVYQIYDRPEWKTETLTLDKIFIVTHPDDLKRFKQTVNEALQNGTSYQMDYRIKTKDHQTRIIHIRGDSVYDSDGHLHRLIGIVQDVTKIREMENNLVSNNERLQKIYDSLDMIVCSFNLDHKRLDYVSKGIERMINVKLEHVYHDDFNWTKFIHPADLKKFSSNRRRILRGEKVKHDYRIISRDSQIKWVEEQAIPIFDEKGKIKQIDGVLVDFTERKHHEQQMEFIANHDHLTGLKNRRNFEYHLQHLINQRDTEPFWLLYLDLDNFKSINDSLGHEIGDKVLVLSATKIENIIEDRGVAARLNGDEFIIMINKLHEQESIHDIANQLKASLERKIIIDEFHLQVTSSIGISRYPDHGSTLNQLINNADRAVHYVKNIGKNSWQIFEDNVKKRTYDDFELEQDLHFAVDKNQLELHLQPIMGQDEKDIQLAEALVRWKHPEHGYIPPNVFIPIAERSGIIHQIDQFVLNRTCETLHYWNNKSLTITNNVSPKRFLRQSFKDNVMDTLKHYQVDPNQIIFEITETTLIHDYEIVNKTINEFRNIGIRFALDDFGTGYSSIAHVSMFNIDFLKIDRQFIQDIHKHQKNQAILRGIMNFTKELEIPMIAEGIEINEELNFLRGLNCKYFQGYYFAKPSNLDEFKNLLR